VISLTQMQERALAIGLLVIALVVCYFVLVQPPLSLYRSGERDIEQLQERLQRYRTIARQRTAHEKELEQLRLREAVQDYFLKSETDALAAAEMQEYVKSVIGESGGDLVSMRVLPVAHYGRFSSVSIRVEMTGNVETVLLAFYALESGQPLVVIDELYMQPERRRRRRGAPMEKSLEIRFKLSGFRQARA
jgi:general secretion pathway protein M